VESHDTYCNDGDTADMTEHQILYGWALLAARKDSTPLFFNRPAGSSPGKDTRWGDHLIGPKGNDHFKSPEISALNHFKLDMRGAPEHLSNPVGGTRVLMIERAIGAVIINTRDEAVLEEADVHNLYDGAYTCKLTGNDFTVLDGKISGTVIERGVMVLYRS
jgi:alpha-amylase